MTESIHKWSARQRGREPVQVILPGGDALSPVGHAIVPPPGSVLVSTGAVVHTEDYVEVARVWHRHPWCPVLLLGNQPPAAEDVALIAPEGMRLHILSCGFLPAVNEIHLAVHPPIPTETQLCTYLGLRLGVEARWAVSRALHAPEQTRELRQLGLLPPGEWRALINTTLRVALGVTEGLSETATAARTNILVRTLSRQCGDHFGLSWPDLKSLVHWEAMLETALRHKGMVS